MSSTMEGEFRLIMVRMFSHMTNTEFNDAVNTSNQILGIQGKKYTLHT